MIITNFESTSYKLITLLNKPHSILNSKVLRALSILKLHKEKNGQIQKIQKNERRMSKPLNENLSVKRILFSIIEYKSK